MECLDYDDSIKADYVLQISELLTGVFMESDKLKKLLEQRKALDAKIQLEQNKENEKKRKEYTRRKILAGAAVLDEAAKHPKFKEELYSLLGRFLKRNDERALFGLSVAQGAETKKPETEVKPEEKVKTTI